MIQYGVQNLSTILDKKNPTLMQIYTLSFQEIPHGQGEPVAELLLLNIMLAIKEWKSRSIANNCILLTIKLAVQKVKIFIFASSY